MAIDHNSLNLHEKDCAWAGETVRAVKSLKERTNGSLSECHNAVICWVRIESARNNKRIQGKANSNP